jgi:hypothetical protein
MDLRCVLPLKGTEICAEAVKKKQAWTYLFLDSEACIAAFTKIFRAGRFLDFFKLWFLCEIDECALMLRTLDALFVPQIGIGILEHLCAFHIIGEETNVVDRNFPNPAFVTTLEMAQPSFLTAVQRLPSTMQVCTLALHFPRDAQDEFSPLFLKNNMLMHLCLRLSNSVLQATQGHGLPDHVKKECFAPLLNQFWNGYTRLSENELLTLINATAWFFKMVQQANEFDTNILDAMLELAGRDEHYTLYRPVVLKALMILPRMVVQEMSLRTQIPLRMHSICRAITLNRPEMDELLQLCSAMCVGDSLQNNQLLHEPFLMERTALYMLVKETTPDAFYCRYMAICVLAVFSEKHPGRNVIEAVFSAVTRAMMAFQSDSFNAYVVRICICMGNVLATMRLMALLDEPAFAVWSNVLSFAPFNSVIRVDASDAETDFLTAEPVLRKFKYTRQSESVCIETMLTAFAVGGMLNPFTNLPITWDEIFAANDVSGLSL